MYKYGEPDKYGEFPYLYSGKWNSNNLNEILMERLPESYNIQLVDPLEAEILAEVVNQGIDAHLEAVTAKSKARIVNVKDQQNRTICRKLEFIPDKQGMICLIRRLIEYLDNCQDDLKWEPAYNLISCIFETLQIEFNV